MRARVLILLLCLASVAFTPAVVLAGDAIIKWSDVPGITEPGSTVGSGSGKVTGGGLPWSTTKGTAEVNLDKGRVKFEVRGLVLGALNSVGTPGGVTMVKGTLVCDTFGNVSGHSVLVDTDLVPLSAQGDADFHGDVGMLPAECFEPDIAFLIRTGGTAWIAYGAVRRP
jgi:hypothetical protein